jgi:ankyrin repeat protein/serine/threonine protein kinase
MDMLAVLNPEDNLDPEGEEEALLRAMGWKTGLGVDWDDETFTVLKAKTSEPEAPTAGGRGKRKKQKGTVKKKCASVSSLSESASASDSATLLKQPSDPAAGASGHGVQSCVLRAGEKLEGMVTYHICADEEQKLVDCKGGQGQVYRGYCNDDKCMERSCDFALKVQLDPRRLRVQAREVQSYFNIDPTEHPHLAFVVDVLHDGRVPLLVMDWASNGSLHDWLQKVAGMHTDIPQVETALVKKALEYAIQIARGLQSLHGLGMVHQDLKPSKVLLYGSSLKLAGFGLCCSLVGESIAGEADAEGSDTAVAENGRLGLVHAAHGRTHGFMAPEQTAAQLWLDGKVDEPEHTAVQTGAPSQKQKGCDVWSFGLLLAAMLGGKVAKGAAEYRNKQVSAGTGVAVAVLVQEVEQLIVSRVEANAGPVWAAIASLLRQCFTASPSQRPSAAACEDQLQHCYRQLSGDRKCYGTNRAAAMSGFNLGIRFPPRVCAARFYTAALRDHGAAAALLRVQLVDELAKVPKQRNGRAKKALQQARQALQQGASVECALAEARDFVPNAELGGGSLLLAVLMDLVDMVYRGAGGGSGEAGGGGGSENAKAVQAAGALAVQVQLAWYRAVDKGCCSYRLVLGSTRDGLSPLFRWCMHDNADAVRMLLDHAEVDVNRAETSDGATPLFIACQNGHANVARVLFGHASIDVNRARLRDGATPLFLASQIGHKDAVCMLLGHASADVDRARTDNGATPLFLASQNGHTDVVRMLLGHASVDADRARTDNGCTPLFAACVNGHLGVVRLLLGHAGVDVNRARVDDGATPLHAACVNGRAELVRMMLDHACVNVDQVTTDQAETPLFIACQKGHAEAVRMLLAAGARADLPATDGGRAVTCVQVAQRKDHTEVVALLEGASTEQMRKKLDSKHIQMSKVLLAEQQAAEQAAELELELAAAAEKKKRAEVQKKVAHAAKYHTNGKPEELAEAEWDTLSPAQFAILQAMKQLAAPHQ